MRKVRNKPGRRLSDDSLFSLSSTISVLLAAAIVALGLVVAVVVAEGDILLDGEDEDEGVEEDEEEEEEEDVSDQSGSFGSMISLIRSDVVVKFSIVITDS